MVSFFKRFGHLLYIEIFRCHLKSFSILFIKLILKPNMVDELLWKTSCKVTAQFHEKLYKFTYAVWIVWTEKSQSEKRTCCEADLVFWDEFSISNWSDMQAQEFEGFRFIMVYQVSFLRGRFIVIKEFLDHYQMN